jgi:hypothetical protein
MDLPWLFGNTRSIGETALAEQGKAAKRTPRTASFLNVNRFMGKRL